MLGRSSSWIGCRKPMWDQNCAGRRWGRSVALNTPSLVGPMTVRYDISNPSSLVVDGSNRVSLIADTSGNSNVNVLALNGVNGNYASYAALTPFGTGDFTLVAEAMPTSFAANGGLVGSVANGCAFFVNTNSRLQTAKDGVANNTQSTTPLTAFTRYTFAYVRSGGNLGTYYVNGVSAGTTVDSQNYTVGQTMNGALNTVLVLNGVIYKCRVYSVALDATAILNDYNGAIQANNVLNIDYGLVPKLTPSFTATTGGTVAINSTGDLGARICGARDLVQLTASKQPVYLPYSGTNYGYLNGSSANYFSTPDSAAVSITGDIDIRAHLSMVDWTPGNEKDIVAKWATGQQSYLFRINTAGSLVFFTSTDGSNAGSRSSTVAVGATDFSALWVRVTFDVDNGAGSRVTTFYTSTDGTAWTQLGAAVSEIGTTSIFNSTAQIRFSGNYISSATESVSGNIYRAQIYNGIAGTLAFDFNPATYVSGTTFLDSSSNAATITLNGGSTIVTRTCLYFDGSDDYMKAAAFALSQPDTVYFVGSQVTWTNSDRLFDGGTLRGGEVFQNSSSPNICAFYGGGSPFNTASNGGLSVGVNGVVTTQFNSSSSFIRVNRNNSVGGGPVGTSSMNGFTLGSAADGSFPANITVSEIDIYSAAHTTSQQNRMALYFSRKWGFTV